MSGAVRPWDTGESDVDFVVSSSRLDRLLTALGQLTTPFEELPPGLTAVNPRLHGDPVLVGEINGFSYLIEDAGTAFAHCWGLLARTARDRFSATWGLSETGAAGPTGNPYGDAPGHTCIAISGEVERALTVETGDDDRFANMQAFARASLGLLLAAIEKS